MEKLKLSFRILSKIPKQLSHEATPKPHSLSSLNPIHCFYKYPVFPKQNAQLQHQRRRLVDRIFFAGSQFPRRHYHHGYRSYNTRISGTSTSEIVTLGLLGVNLAVFVLWRCVDTEFMGKHFMLSVNSFTSGRLHTLITSAFSQMDLEHLFCNMVCLYNFGSRIEYHFGGKFLLKLYLAGALGGSIFYLVHHSFIAPISKGSGIGTIDPKTIQGLGASGAVNAIMLLYIFLNPKAVFHYNFIIPIPGFLLGAVLIGHDLYRIKENSEISGSAHLGGAFVAALKRTRIRKRF